MAPLPAGQPGLRVPGDGERARAHPPGRPRLRVVLAARAAAGIAAGLARYAGVRGPDARSEALRALGVVLPACGLFAVTGFGVVRLWLPASLRRHELLWVLPAGACTTALGVGALGYAYVPYVAALIAVGLGGVVLAVVAWRREGPPALRGADADAGAGVAGIAWPLYIAALVCAVALIPMFWAGFSTVIGEGSDAHLAVGTAEFLQHGHYPTSVAPQEPIDQVPLVWRSKPPIYYALAAVSSVSGQEPYASISAVAALLVALAAVGFFLVAREMLGAGVGVATVAMTLVALDRIVLHTAMHPYFNQTWGFFALPFALVLGPVAVRERSRGALGLFALFLAVLGLAYPLALPIPLVAVGAAWWAAGGGRPSWPWGRRSLLWAVPLVLVALVPLYGVAEKSVTAARIVLPRSDLGGWGGDLSGYLPWDWFAAANSPGALAWVAVVLAVGTVLALRRAPREVALSLGAAIAFGLIFAVYFRARDHGFYFHFKVLAFTAPIAITCAAVGIARVRIAGPVILALWLLVARGGAAEEVRVTTNQLPQTVLDVRRFDRALPPSATVRLDMTGPQQIWVNYFLSGQPTCSQTPLLATQYPHVPFSINADYVVADADRGRPADAVGPRLGATGDYDLYRLRSGLAGPKTCARKMVQTVTKVR